MPCMELLEETEPAGWFGKSTGFGYGSRQLKPFMGGLLLLKPDSTPARRFQVFKLTMDGLFFIPLRLFQLVQHCLWGGKSPRCQDSCGTGTPPLMMVLMMLMVTLFMMMMMIKLKKSSTYHLLRMFLKMLMLTQDLGFDWRC